MSHHDTPEPATPDELVDESASTAKPPFRPPQFRMSTLLLAVGFLCGLLAIYHVFGVQIARHVDGRWVLVLLVFAVAVFAHVAGNSMGTRLRAHGDRCAAEQSRLKSRRGPYRSIYFAPATRLREHTRLSWQVYIPVVLGALTGAIGGGKVLLVVNADKANWANMTLGVVSFLVLGGLFGFWASSFCSILGHAISQAHRESNRR